MSVHRRNVTYFDSPGFTNTSSVVNVVRERMNLGDVKRVVVPVTTGRTAEAFDRELKEKTSIVTVSEDEVIVAFKTHTLNILRLCFVELEKRIWFWTAGSGSCFISITRHNHLAGIFVRSMCVSER